MAVCESVERRVRLDGPWGVWFPVVQDSLAASGCSVVAADAAQRRLTARYGDSRIGGRVTVTLAPCAPPGETETVVAVTAGVGGGCA